MATLVPAAPIVKTHNRLLPPPSRGLFLISSTSHTCSRRPFPRCRSMMGGARGDNDFGARDPFPAEIASNFGDKVLGNKDTEHKILIPNLAVLSLAQQQISTTFTQPIPEDHAQQLLRKVIGWRLVNDVAGLKLQCLWKLKDCKSGVELINRIYSVLWSLLHITQPFTWNSLTKFGLSFGLHLLEV